MHPSFRPVSRIVRFLNLSLVCATAFVTAQAQTMQWTMSSSIPFRFEWNGHVYSAGHYFFTTNGPFVAISDGNVRTAALSRPEDGLSYQGHSNVVFHHIGDRYFLREIWVKGSPYHLDFGEGKAEVRARQDMQRLPGAGLTENAVVALQ